MFHFSCFFLSHKQKTEGDVVLEKIVPLVGYAQFSMYLLW